jgi:hypothetical protein
VDDAARPTLTIEPVRTRDSVCGSICGDRDARRAAPARSSGKVVDGETFAAQLEEERWSTLLSRARRRIAFAASRQRPHRHDACTGARAGGAGARDLRALHVPLVVASSLTALPWQLVHDDEEQLGEYRYPLGARLLIYFVRERSGRRADDVPRDRETAHVALGSSAAEPVGGSCRRLRPENRRGLRTRSSAPRRRPSCIHLNRLADVRSASSPRLGDGLRRPSTFCGHVVRPGTRSGIPALLAGRPARRLPAPG